MEFEASVFTVRAAVEHDARFTAFAAPAWLEAPKTLQEPERSSPRHNVKMTGPPTLAAKPPCAVVGPCRLTS
jgi:hypothetical protein